MDVIVERLPEVLSLPTDEKEILARNCSIEWSSNGIKTPALVDLLRHGLDERRTHPEGGVRWEELRGRLLKRRHAMKLSGSKALRTTCFRFSQTWRTIAKGQASAWFGSST